MDVVLIALYVFVNIIITIIFYKKPLGVFQAPFLVGCISLTITLPQLTSIYFMPDYYDNKLLYKLCYVMITCNIAFAGGFIVGKKTKLPKTLSTFNLGNLQYLNLVFSLIGFLTIFIYNGGLSGSIDTVIASNLKIFAILGMSISFVLLLNGYKSKLIYLSLALSLSPIINFAFFFKGSRGDSLVLMMNIMLFVALYAPKTQRTIKILLTSFLLVGSILSASITKIRNYIKDEETASSQVSFFEQFKHSFMETNVKELGMDLGNAAIGIEYCFENASYDYGLQLWNSMVFSYVPKRLVGEETKSGMMYNAGYEHIIPELTGGVTTMTGYFYAFAAFSFFGFLFFFIIGYIYGIIWNRANYSSFYKVLYFYVFAIVPLVFTHGLQYFFANLEMLLIILYPILSIFIYKISRVEKSHFKLT